MLATTIMGIPGGLAVGTPRDTAGAPATAMLGVQAIGLHQSWQTGAVGLMALGTTEGVLGVVTPPFNRLVNPVYRAEVLVLGDTIG